MARKDRRRYTKKRKESEGNGGESGREADEEE